jgi:hypothetical protein
MLDATPIPAVLDEPDRAGNRVRRIFFETERQREVEQGLCVDLP